MSDNTEKKIANLEKSIHQLLGDYSSKKKMILQLSEENNTLKKEIIGLKEELSNFQNQDKIAKIVSNTTVEREESAELKLKLNEYIKEIDRCITYLS